MNRYVEGALAPVEREVTAFDLPIVGHLPPELDGRYLRNGPNPIGPVDPATHHWFVGEGMVHGIRLRDGRAEWYRNRWVRAGAVPSALGEPDPGGEVHADMDGAANTNVIVHAGRTLAIVEAGSRPVELTDDLETVQRFDFGGTLPNGFTAHPKRCPTTGELHAACYWWGFGNIIQYLVVDAAGRVVHVAPIEVGGPIMVHDMSITATQAVVYDLPVIFDLDMALSGATLPYRWSDAHQARIGVLPRGGTNVDTRWFDIDPGWIFHPLNAYDDGADRVVLDVVRYARVFDVDRLGPSEEAATLWRYIADRSTGRISSEQLDDRPEEFPRVDERVVGQRHRFGYSAAIERAGSDFLERSAVMKRDLATGTTVCHRHRGDAIAGEPVFVPRSDDAAEDDGWLLSIVYDMADDSSHLVVIDAQHVDHEPVAIVELPQRVPIGFHGNWITAGD